jgi:glycosyl transferase family 25
MIAIYIITNGDKDRKQRISSQLDGYDFSFISPPPQSELKEENHSFLSRQLSFKSRGLSVGQFAAWKAHYMVWEKIRDSMKPALIIEDNALIHEKFDLSLLKREIINYGVISFSETGMREVSGSPFIKRKGFLPLYSYGVSPYFADMLVNRANKNGFSIQVDTWLTKPKLCGTHSFCSNFVISSRTPRFILDSIAQKDIPKKSNNLYYAFLRWKNKRKYLK